MSKYKYEIAVAIVGGIISIIELFLDIKFCFFIISITILLDLSMLGMREYIKDCLREYSEFYNSLYNIGDKYWKSLAEKELIHTRELLEQMKQGTRTLKANNITSEELRLIRQAKKLIYCTYYADSLIKLRFRLNDKSKYNPMQSINLIYKDLANKKICKKRIFILDRIDVEDSETKKILKEIEEYYSSDIIGFKVRYIFYSKLREMNIVYHGNIILVDNLECTLCSDNTQYPNDYFERDQNIMRDVKASNVINATLIKEYKSNFEAIWEMALPYSEFI
ncbi:MAG: hypothetical protein NC433_07700 [Clostridiales bacterium]|nr:hypothetical protein [Clostridiales bacterium]